MSQTLKGGLEFQNVEMRYQLHLEPAIKNLSFKIEQGEKIAIVGRTGAGKSSLF
jgi:ABC-type multidrug transport system fused ATPase/permease subunit